MTSKFKLDTRNTGGLKQIADNMYFHHKALVNAKPAISIKPPKPHVSVKKQVDPKKPIVVDLPMYKNKAEFNNVFKTFQTVLEMRKGGIDSSAPVSMNFRRNLTGNVSKAEKHQSKEHALNLLSQQRRIQSASSKTERKKNQSDPITHPPHLFRREGQSLANMRIDKLLEHMTKQHRAVDTPQVQSLVEYNKKQQMEGGEKLKKQQRARPQSSKPPKAQKFTEADTIRIQAEVAEFVDQVPKVSGNGPKDYEQLKKDLIGTIFKYRIYRGDDLESLFGRVLVHNTHLDLERCEQIFQDIRDEFQQ